MSNNRLNKEYNAIDILKLVLAFFVSVIHSGVDKTVISPVLRTAVPLFFMISAYFFFSKIAKLSEKKEKNQALFRLVKRNLLLYLIWAIVQLPLLYIMRGYHQQSGFYGAWYAIRDILLGGGFTGAWYIVTLAAAVAVIFWLSRKVPAGWLMLLTVPLYVFCCFATNYYYLLGGDSFVITISEGYHRLTGMYIYTSLPVALFWVSAGRFLAERKPEIQTWILIVGAVVFGILLGLERYWIVRGGFAITDDCYFMLMLFCPVVFLLVSRSQMWLSTGIPIRQWSTVLYVTHGCCSRIIGYGLKLMPFSLLTQNIVKIALTLLASLLLCKILIYFSEKRNISVLKYAY